MIEILRALRECDEYAQPTERWQSTGQLIHEAADALESLLAENGKFRDYFKARWGMDDAGIDIMFSPAPTRQCEHVYGGSIGKDDHACIYCGKRVGNDPA
jgi:hypothetical protein